MLKKEIHAFFKEVKNGNIAIAASMIDKTPELVNAPFDGPPKKDEGQSALQVALKSGDFAMAELLISKGADVNFIEAPGSNVWTAPVLHDCIKAVIFNCYTLQKEEKMFDRGLLLLKTMVFKKADVNAVDSYGNNCLHRAVMDAKQMLENTRADFTNGILLGQLRKVFSVLINAGANPAVGNAKRPPANELIANFKLDKYNLF